MNLISSGPFLIFTAAILWAFDGVLRRSLFALPPVTIVFYEHLIGSLILLLFIYPQLKHLHLPTKTKISLLWISFFSSVMGTLLFTSALTQTQFIPFSVVFLLQKLQPLFTHITARLLLREKLPPHFFPWATLALISAFFVTFPQGHINLNTPATTTAALLALGAAFAWGSSTVFSKIGLNSLPHLTLTGLRFFLATPIALIFVVLTHQTPTLFILTSSQLLRLLLIALSTGMVALAIYYKGLKTTPASVATIIELAFPLTAIFIDLTLYQTPLHSTQYLAGTILLYSIFKLTKKTHYLA